MVKPIKAVEARQIRDDLVEIEDEVPYKGDIVPTSKKQLKRPITIGRSAQVDGIVFGKKVELHEGSSEKPTKVLSVYGENQVLLYDRCLIGGNVQSNGIIDIGKNNMIIGDVIGEDIKVSENTRIGGNVIAKENINIDHDVEIGGFVISLNGSVAIGDNSSAFDVIAEQDIVLGKDVVLQDPIIWSQNGKINFTNVKFAERSNVTSKDVKIVKPNEINPYYIASDPIDYQPVYDSLKESFKALKDE